MNDSSWAMAALDVAPYATLLVGEDARIVFASARARAIAAAPLVGALAEELFAVESGAALREAMRAPPARLDVFGLGAAGVRATFEVSVGRLGAPSEALRLVSLRDVTEPRREEERRAAASREARATLERLDALMEFAPAFIIGVSREGTINFINRTLPQYSKKDVMGVSWLQFFPPERQEVMKEALAAAYATESTQTFETSTPGPDGVTLWFASQIAPVRSQGKIVGAVLVSQDVTEKKRANAELLAGRHMALLGTLAAGVAHEINTPIQYVGDSIHFLRDASSGLLALLEKLHHLRRAAVEGSPLADAVSAAATAEKEVDLPFLQINMPSAFEACVEGLDRVATIVRSLNEFARPSDAEMAPADLNRALESALTIATNEYKLVAEVRTELGDLPLVTCHAGEMSQVFLNIIVNAAHAIGDVVKGTTEKGVITVRTRRERDHVVISIADTGGGIAEGIRTRVFDPFFTTKPVGKGTGQGLAIAWSTVREQHGGDLSFDSEVGKGTTFFIRLPIAGKSAS